jgi:high-affinity nickel permease
VKRDYLIATVIALSFSLVLSAINCVILIEENRTLRKLYNQSIERVKK